MAESTDQFFATNERCAWSTPHLDTGLVGYVLCTYDELVSVFGPPNGEGDDFKVSTVWSIKDARTGIHYTLYDYKQTDRYSSVLPSVEEFRGRGTPYDWYVGGPVGFQLSTVNLAMFLSDKLGHPVAVRRV